MDEASRRTLDRLDAIGWENWTDEDWDAFLEIKEAMG